MACGVVFGDAAVCGTFVCDLLGIQLGDERGEELNRCWISFRIGAAKSGHRSLLWV